MKKTKTKKHMTVAILAVGASFLMLQSQTEAAMYNVSINTAPLASLPADGPYYLDFQFSSGNTVGNNTISLSNFSLTGGSATGSASLFGAASGNLTSGVTLTDSTTPSEVYQQFTTGTSRIAFTVNTTQNVDAGLTPDMFSVGILDSSLGLGSPAQIYTTSPDQLSLMTETINSATSLNLGFYQGVGPADGSNSGSFAGIAAVPEPVSIGAIFSASLMGMSVLRRKRARIA